MRAIVRIVVVCGLPNLAYTLSYINNKSDDTTIIAKKKTLHMDNNIMLHMFISPGAAVCSSSSPARTC